MLKKLLTQILFPLLLVASLFYFPLATAGSKSSSDQVSSIAGTAGATGYGFAAFYTAKASGCSGTCPWYIVAAVASAAYAIDSYSKQDDDDDISGLLDSLKGGDGLSIGGKGDRDGLDKIGAKICKNDPTCNQVLSNIRGNEINANGEFCLGDKADKYPCLQLNEDGKPIRAVLRKDTPPISMTTLDKKVQAFSKNPQFKKTQNHLGKVMAELKDDLFPNSDLDSTNKKEKRLASKEGGDRSDSSLEDRYLAEGSLSGNKDSSNNLLADLDAKKKKGFENLFAQFRDHKGTKKSKLKSISLGQNEIGISQDNIFFMVHRRYKERSKAEQFISAF